MFPLEFPQGVLESFAQVGDWVFDPFCGRGTTNYASRLEGLPSIGIDSSPVAVAITEAKLSNVIPDDIVSELAQILASNGDSEEIPQEEFWKLAFDASVLRDVSKVRESLVKSCATDVRRALRGIMLGALHGPRRKVGSGYFSNQSPRTYAPKPNYAINYWKKNQLVPPKVDILEIVKWRAKRFFDNQPKSTSRVILGDSRDIHLYKNIPHEIKWVITSPPYYGLRTYIPDQWIRMWFLGGKSTVDYSAEQQIKHSSQQDFINDLRKIWVNTSSVCKPDAKLIVRFGGINDRKVNHLELISASLENTKWNCIKVESAGMATKGRRQSRQMNKNTGNAIEEFDIWAVLV